MSSPENQSKISSGGKGGARPGAGRPKGAVDKGNKLIREMICLALDQVGGVDYLVEVAKSHPTAFVSLLGKVMPVQVEGSGGGPIITAVQLVPMHGNSPNPDS